MSTVEPCTKFAEITDKWGRFRSIAIVSPDTPTVSVGEDGFLWLDTLPDAPVLKVWDEDASAWVVVGTEASEVSVEELGEATFDSLQDWLNNTQSSGYIDCGIITDAGSGKINVSCMTGFIKTTDSEIGETLAFDMAETIGLEMTDVDTNYIYVDYNDGAPKVVATTTRSDIEMNRHFTLGRVHRYGTTLHIIQSGTQLPNATREDHERLIAVRGFERASGGAISETGDRYLESTAGVFYLGQNKSTTTGVDTTGAATFTRHYHSGGDWTSDTASQICAAAYQYDNGTDLANISVARYGVFWVYIHFDSDLHVIVGRGNYKLAEAQAATVPATPGAVSDFGTLAAKIIIAQGGTNFISVQSAYVTPFQPSTAVNHNDLGSIQGGAADDYYHMTQAQHTPATRDATNAQNGLMPTAKLDAWDAAYTHIGESGASHLFIDQDVTIGAGPAFTDAALTTPAIGTPSAGVLTNCTGLPVATGISGLAANVATFLATPSSANLIAAVTDETGSGALVFADTPTLVTPEIGAATGTSLVLTGDLTASGGRVTAGAAAQVGTVEIYDGSDHKVTLTSPGLAGDWTLTLPIDDGDANEVLITDGAGATSWSAVGSGDVTAAAALTDNLIVRGDVAAKAVQTSGITIADNDDVSGMGTLGCGNITSTGTVTGTDMFVGDGGTFGITGNELLTVNAAGNFVFSGANVGIGGTPSELLEIIAAGGVGSATSPILQIRDTFNGTRTAADQAWGIIDFYSDDTSAGGPAKRARIATENYIDIGSQTNLAFYVSTNTDPMTLDKALVLRHNTQVIMPNLAGVGNRAVIASAAGVLSAP